MSTSNEIVDIHTVYVAWIGPEMDCCDPWASIVCIATVHIIYGTNSNRYLMLSLYTAKNFLHIIIEHTHA